MDSIASLCTCDPQGCEFQVVRAHISPEFEQIYDLCARQWELLRQVRHPKSVASCVRRCAHHSFMFV